MSRKRREYLALLAIAAPGAFAGCTGNEDDDDETEQADEDAVENGDEPSDTGDDMEEDGDDKESNNEDGMEEDDGEDGSESEFVDEIDEQVVLEYGETAHVSNGVDVTAHGITIYERMGDEQPEERDVFAVLEVETANTSDEQRYLPDATDQWEVFYGEQQVGQTFNSLALDAEGYNALEGGDVQGGVTREGVILFEVDEGYDADEIEALWSDNFMLVDDLDQEINVRWTNDP